MDKLINTFGIDARCTKLLEFSNVDELKEFWPEIAEARRQGKLLIIGRGSNLLPTGDYDGLVVRSRIMGRTVVESHAPSGSLPTEGSPMLITSEYVQSGGRGRWPRVVLILHLHTHIPRPSRINRCEVRVPVRGIALVEDILNTDTRLKSEILQGDSMLCVQVPL